jgi:hypothetical protein
VEHVVAEAVEERQVVVKEVVVVLMDLLKVGDHALVVLAVEADLGLDLDLPADDAEQRREVPELLLLLRAGDDLVHERPEGALKRGVIMHAAVGEIAFRELHAGEEDVDRVEDPRAVAALRVLVVAPCCGGSLQEAVADDFGANLQARHAVLVAGVVRELHQLAPVDVAQVAQGVVARREGVEAGHRPEAEEARVVADDLAGDERALEHVGDCAKKGRA